jgi:NodT family efflux transporter outer membrane factor (OMF) lipoprotein
LQAPENRAANSRQIRKTTLTPRFRHTGGDNYADITDKRKFAVRWPAKRAAWLCDKRTSRTEILMANRFHAAILDSRQPRFDSRRVRLCYVVLLLIPAVFNCGCTSWREYFSNGFKVGPNFDPPPASVAQKWIDAADARVRSEEGDQSHWWTVFKDPILDSLIETSYRQNLTLRDAGFRIMQARAQLGIARGSFFPQTQTMVGDYLREAASRNSANRSFIGTRYFDQYDYGFGLAWELDFWGRFRRMIESADERLNVSVQNYDAVLVTLLGDVASNYVLIRTLERQIELTRQNAELQRKTLILADARFKGGTATDLDVQQAKSVLKQTEAQIPVLEISLRQANNQLCTLMGMPPEDLHKQLGAGEIPTAPAIVVTGIPADLLRRRPDVLEAERAAAAQSAQIGIAAAEFYPHISLVGTLDYSTKNLGKLIEPGSFQGTAGPIYTWNILNYGRILNNVRYQDALLQQLIVDYQNTVLTAAKEVENGLVTFLKSQQETALQAESVEAANKAVQIALAQYQGGQVDFNRVATLELLLVQQQNILAQARGQIATGLINVYRALGGGWQIRLDPASTGPLPTDGPPAVPPPAVVPPAVLPRADGSPAAVPPAQPNKAPELLPAP